MYYFPWLLNTEKCEIEQNVSVDNYAILSHRWEKKGEVKFNTLKPGDLHRSKKISGACQTARSLGFKYLWIDSVCMDKSNAVETSTAINSMFKYYHDADLCLTYLSDVDSNKPRSRRFESFKQPGQDSVWFTRGWTLQEMLASPTIHFYDVEWRPIGLKREGYHVDDQDDIAVKQDLQTSANIDARYLDGDLKFREVSVATRMSWMAGRRTERVEDIAYSMLGILDVTMDLQYGEGERAFLRLQRLLLQGSRDESIFAWTTCQQGLKCYSPAPPESPGPGLPTPAEVPSLPWEPTSWGLLAPSPDCFAKSGHVVVAASAGRRDYAWLQDAVQFQVPLKAGSDATNWLGLPRKEIKFALNCWADNGSKKPPAVVIHLKSKDGSNYVRVRCDTLDLTPGAKPSDNRVLGIEQVIRRPLTVGQPPFTLSKSGQHSFENPYADAPKAGSRLQTTNAALASRLNDMAKRGS